VWCNASRNKRCSTDETRAWNECTEIRFEPRPKNIHISKPTLHAHSLTANSKMAASTCRSCQVQIIRRQSAKHEVICVYTYSNNRTRCTHVKKLAYASPQTFRRFLRENCRWKSPYNNDPAANWWQHIGRHRSARTADGTLPQLPNTTVTHKRTRHVTNDRLKNPKKIHITVTKFCRLR